MLVAAGDQGKSLYCRAMSSLPTTVHTAERRAKIMATLGPASNTPDVLRSLIQAGVNIVRLNLSHGTHKQHAAVVRSVRALAEELRRYVPVVVDLMGPRYRLGQVIDGPRVLDVGDTVQLGPPETGVDLPVEDAEIVGYLQPGERVLIDNGLIELRVESRQDEHVLCRVVHGGSVTTRKGINLPDTDLPFHISEKDEADIRFAIAIEADLIAASYVGRAQHVHDVRARIVAAGGDLPVIAKLERAAAVEDSNLRAILGAANGVMVARGDLGVEVPLDQVPVLQKKIIAAGRRAGRPVIVATQMIESMMEQPRPTRAEVSDIANAVFDGADVLMLSGETAAGRYPVEAVQTMARIIQEAEAYQEGVTDYSLGPMEVASDALEENLDISNAVSAAAARAAEMIDVKYIVAFSQGGFTARLVTRYRPQVPVLAFTVSVRLARRLQTLWGVQPIVLEQKVEHHDEVAALVDRYLRESGLAQPGDALILLMGDPISERPRTNLLRVHRVRAADPES